MPKIYCQAIGCGVSIPHTRLMCLAHWRMVPKELQHSVWAHYQVGQEDDLSLVTTAYRFAARRAIYAVAVLEKKISANEAAKQLRAIKPHDEESRMMQ